MQNDPDTQPRRLLTKLRQLWDAHSPSSPIYLNDELAPNITVSQFCVKLLMTQRSRRPKLEKNDA